jgi:rhodanese-related sulfurtransferase
MEKKFIATGILFLLIGALFSFSVIANDKQVSFINFEKSISNFMNCNITNITVQETWDLLNDSGNGIQIPIDVRTESEWNDGYIDTPFPECPVWYCLDLLDNETGLQEFIDMFDGEEVILYCKGGYRSLVGAYILCDSNFTGTIYNMLGGINSWKSAGFPIRNNTGPDSPDIEGPICGKTGEEYTYNFSTVDDEEDGVYYWIDWDDETPLEWIGPYESDQLVQINHTWDKKGTYLIKAKVKDFYGNESSLTEHEVTMPRYKKILTNSFLNYLFNKYLILQKILRFF